VRFRLDHPTDPELRAEYGFDPTPLVQWFVEIFLAPRVKPLATYDALHRCDRDQPLLGALRFLVEQTFVSGEDLDAAIEAFGAPYRVRLSRSARKALEVIENLKAASE
jgi:hypothetical protein